MVVVTTDAHHRHWSEDVHNEVVERAERIASYSTQFGLILSNVS